MLMKRKLTIKRLNALILDERKASKEYLNYGFISLAKDEKRHEKFLIALKKKMTGN